MCYLLPYQFWSYEHFSNTTCMKQHYNKRKNRVDIYEVPNYVGAKHIGLWFYPKFYSSNLNLFFYALEQLMLNMRSNWLHNPIKEFIMFLHVRSMCHVCTWLMRSMALVPSPCVGQQKKPMIHVYNIQCSWNIYEYMFQYNNPTTIIPHKIDLI